MSQAALTVARIGNERWRLPASGKTTWAKAQVAAVPPGRVVRVNRDDLRLMLHGEPHHIGVTEQQITAAQHNAIRALLADGVTVIVDDTNLQAPPPEPPVRGGLGLFVFGGSASFRSAEARPLRGVE